MADDRAAGTLNGARIAIVSLSENWPMVASRGIAAIVFGLLALFLPGVTLLALVWLFGAYAVVDGVLAVVAAVRRREGRGPWWALLLEGLVSIAAGLAAFVLPGITALVLVYIIGFWAILTGILEIAAAVRLRKEITNEWWLGLGGALSIVFGALLVALAFRLRRWRTERARPPLARAA